MTRQILVCAIALLFALQASGQSNSATTTFFLQTDVEQGYVLCPSGSGTMYLVGMSNFDMVLMEFGTEGEMLSSRYIDVGISGLDVPAELIVDSDGKLVICGNLKEDSPDYGFVFRYDPVLRKTLWAKTFGSDPALIHGILENGPGGNYLLYSNPHFQDGDDVELLQLNRNTGNIVPGTAWRYNLGTSENITAMELYQGDLYAVGRFTDGLGASAYDDMRQALLKIDPNTGQPIWTRLGHVGPNEPARLYGRDLLVEQDAILSTFSGLANTASDFDGSEVYLQKTNLNGEILWLKKYELPEWSSEVAEELVSVSDGFVLFGRTLDNDDKALFMLKTDKDGNLLWARKMQHALKNRAIGTAQGQMIALGDILFVTGYTEPANGSKQMFLLKVGKDGQISNDCAAFVPTDALTIDIPNPIHYSVDPEVSESLVIALDLPVAPSVLFFPDKEIICQQIESDCQSMPDWTLKIEGLTCDTGSLTVHYKLCNEGGVAATDSVPVSFYLGNPTQSTAMLLGTYMFDGILVPGECKTGALPDVGNDWFPNGISGLQIFYSVVNDNAAWPPPFSLDTFPPTGLIECDYTNNSSFSAILMDSPVLNLGPDLIVCKDSIATFDAGADYYSYLWNDGSTGQTLKAIDPGTYWVEVTDFCGFIQRDSVFFSFSQLADTQFPDTTICPGESLSYAAPGFDTYSWAPAAGLSCTDCSAVTIQPLASTQYTFLGISNLGCVLRDTFWVELNDGPSNLAMQCPSNLVVTAAPNTPAVAVNYNTATANTDCPCGPGDLTLTQGLPSGSNFPIGLTQVCFQAEDDCMTQASCCFTVTVNQTVTDDPCDVKETPCVRFEILGIFQNSAKQKTYRMRVVNKCPDPLQYVVFQLPNGITADLPANNSVYTAPSGRKYEVRNPNASPFHSIRFKTIGAGIAGGASDIFEYTLPPQANPTFIGAVARLAPQQYYETHLNVFACEVKQTIPIPVSGNIRTETGEGVANVEVRVDVTAPGQNPYSIITATDQQGKYAFQVGSNGTYTITPQLNNNYLNGVTTYDLMLISDHLTGTDPLTQPFPMIAADANSSRTISTVDIVELRKLILFIYTELPNSPSWRFVDAGYNFPNPTDPFQTIFPEKISASSPHPANPVHNFTGIKVGDVNGSAAPNVVGSGTLDRSSTDLVLDLLDRELRPGELVTVPVQLAPDLAGFQLGLEYQGLDLLQVIPGTGMGQEHFAVFPAEHLLTASWSEGGWAAFDLQFQAREAGRLSDLLHFSKEKIQAEAYQKDWNGLYQILPLVLRFEGQQEPASQLELYQNQPNPFTGSTSIGFYLPEATKATLRMLDGFGRECFAHTAFYSKGNQTFVLEKEMAELGSGVYYYVLETERERLMRKMVILR